MSEQISPTPNQELKNLLEENLKYSKEILNSTEKIRRYLMVRQVWAFVKYVVIIGLIVLGFITVRPFLDQAISTYKELLGTGAAVREGVSGQVNGEDLQKLLEQYKK